MGDAVADSRFLDRRYRVTAANDRRAVHTGDSLGHTDGSLGKRVDLEHAHWTVPHNRLRVAQRRRVRVDGLWADVEPHPIADRRVVDAEYLCGCAGFELGCDDVIDGEK